MEEHLLETIESLIEGRNTFLSGTIRNIPFQNRSPAMSRFMLNEIAYVELINNVLRSHTQNNIATTVVRLTVPRNFTDNIVVTPTADQISAALQSVTHTTNNCAICQDSIFSDGTRIRQCGHDFHRTCLLSWFAMSVRCPVCRHDIREEGQATQTQTALAQTSSQSEDQSVETDTSE